MGGESGTSHTGQTYYYYKCGNAKRKRGCDKKAVKKDWIERIVVKLTVDKVLQDREIDRIADALIILQDKEDLTIPALKQQLTATEKNIENMLNAIQQSILTKSTKERLEELENQKEHLEISILQTELQKPHFTKELIVKWINQFKYGNVNSREYQKRIIDTFINAIYLFDDKMVLTYNFKGGTDTITLSDIEAAFGSDLNGGTPPDKALTV